MRTWARASLRLPSQCLPSVRAPACWLVLLPPPRARTLFFVSLGADVDHKEFVGLIDGALSAVPAQGGAAAPPSPYEGGYSEARKDVDDVVLSVAFPTAGLKDAAAVDALVVCAAPRRALVCL